MTADPLFRTYAMSRPRTVCWMLGETGAKRNNKAPRYTSTMKTAPYRAIKPMGKAAKTIHGKMQVTECATIGAGPADFFPEAGLALPVQDRAGYDRGLFRTAGPIEHAMIPKALEGVSTEQPGRISGHDSLTRAVDVLESTMAAHDHISEGRFSAADDYAGPQIAWELLFGTLPERAAFTAYAARLSARGAYQRATARDNALMADIHGQDRSGDRQAIHREANA